MATTANFGWTTPADTDLVKDGALSIRTLGNGVDSSMADLLGGAAGQILSKNSASNMDLVWVDNDLRTNSPVNAPLEVVQISSSAPTGTMNIEVGSTGSVKLFTANASANFTLNFRASSSVSLSTLLAVNQSITITVAIPNGATPYYASAIQIDGSAVTPLWQGGTAPTAGSASATDIYSFTIIKTASTPTYKVFASQVKFA